jgi:nicotinamidase-related amidase
MSTVLFAIDCQNSFVEIIDPAQQQQIHSGELCVGGAVEDCNRLATLINKAGGKINDIVATLDCHHEWHISHPCWFVSNGVNPSPFTMMSNVNGEIIGSDGKKYQCTLPSQTKWTLFYLSELEKLGKYKHMIWPPHCLIGTRGNNVVDCVRDAFNTWCIKQRNNVTYKTKGSNPRVEHFSIAKSEVVDPNDFTTELDTDLINLLMNYDRILVCGQAKSHCVRFSVQNIHEVNPDFIKKCVFLEDCSSSVTGFEAAGDTFIDSMKKCGMQVIQSKDF